MTKPNRPPQTTHPLLLLTALLTLLLPACRSINQRLHNTKIITLPTNGQPGHWRASDGKTMPYHMWGKTGQRPVLICIHGLSGASSDFWLVGQTLAKQNYTIYALNLRGQGMDPDLTQRGTIPTHKEWKKDLLEFDRIARALNPGQPIYWLGESLGSLITINTATPRTPDALILTSPIIGIPPSQQELRNYLKLGAFLSPALMISLHDLLGGDLQMTNDTAFLRQMEKTPHYVPNKASTSSPNAKK